MIVVGSGHIISAVLYRALGVLHRHAHTGVGDHGAVIQAVAAGHQVFAVKAHALQKGGKAAVLGHAQRYGFNEERAGGVQVDAAIKLLFACGPHFVPAGRVQCDEHFADGVIHILCQIVHAGHGQLAGKAFAQGPLVVRVLGDNALFIIGDNGHVLCGGKGAQLGYVLGIQLFLVQSLAGAAVDDLAAVVRKDAAALFIQPQFLCQRQHARGGTAGCQHDGNALCNGGIQCSPGAGRDFLLAVGQGAVQIQRQQADGMFHGIKLLPVIVSGSGGRRGRAQCCPGGAAGAGTPGWRAAAGRPAPGG